jgi:16S rRNA (uracil1498-N3)-methyltransferase
MPSPVSELRAQSGSAVTDPLYLADDLGEPEIGDRIVLGGDDGRHAAVVRRTRPGEMIMVGDGLGRGVRGSVVAVQKAGLQVEVTELLTAPEPRRRIVAVQALAKGDRSELAIEMLTEAGVAEIIPWMASRSVVRWSGDRAVKSLSRWRSTVREAAKQSRRLLIPRVPDAVSTRELVTMINTTDRALVLHEEAEQWLTELSLAEGDSVMIIIGPEGGIAPEELEALTAAGAEPVLISDGVLRTSTAGVVAVAGLLLR